MAILDTGYNANHEFFTDTRKRRIVSWRDFTTNSNHPEDDKNVGEGQDTDGHGTDVLSLALRVAPFAEFCVARVFENSCDLSSRVDEIVKVSTSFQYLMSQQLIIKGDWMGGPGL